MNRVAVVVVTYNSEPQVGGCLEALRNVPGIELEVVVVDNASTDRTREMVSSRGVRLIANSTNAGFAAAVNQGTRATSAPLILLLNPDAHLIGGLAQMAECMEWPNAAAVGGTLIDADGRPQTG